MRFMVLVKATADSETGRLPTEQEFAEMGRYNEELVKAGVMKMGEGLHPSSRGARVQFSGARRTVIDGPFAETKELVAGFWLWDNLASLEEAVEWVKRCPNPMRSDSEIEIRRIYDVEDFGDGFTPELQAQEERMRADIAAQQAKAAVQPVPAPLGATPYLTIRGAAEAIAWYEQVVGAKVAFRMDAPDGKVMHAELHVGPARFMLTEERPEHGALSPQAVGGSSTTAILYVPDVDAVVAKALAAGAKQTMPVADQFWGDRSGGYTDPWGHHWMISTHIEDPTPDEVRQRVQKMFAAGGPAGC